jgi:hypothetical protein
MTDENKLTNGPNRRDVLKKIGITGVAATGAVGLTGTATAQQKCASGSLDTEASTSDIESVETQGGTDVTSDVTWNQFEMVITKVCKTSDGGYVDAEVTYEATYQESTVSDTQTVTNIPIQGGSRGGSAGFGAAAQGSCQILFLQLGPIFLDVLGLVVETNQIEVDVRAERGSGNLLGNLLCAIVNLLNR